MGGFGILTVRRLRSAASKRNATGSVLEKVRETVQRYQMLAPGDLAIIAVSGGPDSMCLLHVLNSLKAELGFSAHVAHLNHHMREQAPKDAAMVEEVAKSMGIPCTVGHADVFGLAKERGIGLEEAGRIARYDFFRSLKTRLLGEPAHPDDPAGRRPDTVKFALGHNLNDQAETVFMRLLRGSGTSGLAGIPPVNGDIIRPLIDVPRDTIEEYCQEQGLGTITDVYNLDLKYTRNRIRYETLPALSESFNPSLVETLAKTASALRWDADYLDALAEETFRRVSHKEGRVTSVDEGLLGTIPRAVSSRVVEKAWQECAKTTSSLGFGHARELIEGIGPGGAHSTTGTRSPALPPSLSLPGGVTVHRHERHLRFCPTPVGVDIPLPDPRNVSGRGTVVNSEVAGYVPELGVTIILKLVDGEEAARARQTVLGRQAESSIYTSGYEFCLEPVVYMDYNHLGGPLRLRTRKRGDRFSPLGMNGKSQKLQDFFVSLRLPRFFRDLVPLVTDGTDIIWVGGFRLSEKCKLDRTSHHLLRAEIRPDLRRSANCATI